ncbi:hypothetical protein AgCh_039925 [Apium graveolens]
MFSRFILWISHLWRLLCDFILPSTPNSQTPSTCTSNFRTQPTFVSSLTPTCWDVFLSFRGEDTRLNFTSHLYDKLVCNGLRIFKDDPQLRSGENISNALTQAIHESKTYIVVFSENYASSHWCLNELVQILNCHKTAQRLLIPVFYKIDPGVVRHQNGGFKDAFEKHKACFEMEKLNEWRLTLKQVADLSGHHISDSEDRSEADFLNKIVDQLLLEISPKTLDVAKFPVGLDSRVKDITALLSSDKEGVIRIGIHGMGGVGKTTLAKAVYNQNYRSFHGSCFLADVREASTRENGLVSLQQNLLDNVLKRKSEKIDNVDQGIELIKARICSKKVLIVIDDLDNVIPLEFIVGPFALGSTIIITTRNEDLLDSFRVKSRYKVNGLDDAESHQLFAQHAFNDNKIPDIFTELSQEILKHAGGLPLALKVFGSNLLNQPEGYWRWFVNKLKRVSIEDVENKLMISFQALKSVDPMLQNIYLDIACFFVGYKKKKVVNIMETRYTFVTHHIDILNKRCLLTTNDEDELGMHDLLQEMGRNIARNKSPDEPEKHSRLWVSKDICDVLKKTKGTEAVECIIARDNNQDALKGLSFTTKTFRKMSKLRFLHLEEVNITGSFEHIFEDLRVLCWKCCPLRCLPSEFDPSKLVILKLPHSKLRTVWEQNMVSHVFGKLKTLNMSYSQDLVATPDFVKLPSLETLNLMGCNSLEEVHVSIGSLVSLDSLNLKGCEKLRSLPDTICNLGALKVLNISECISLEALPLQLGNIKFLTKLTADGLSVSRLPDSTGHLTKLVDLYLNNNKNLVALPDSICNLRSLEILNIAYCSSLEALPVAIGNVESLKKIIVCRLTVSKLPDSIGSLTKLVELDLRQNENLETLPDTICNLRSLEILDIAYCSSLEALPNTIGNIESLEIIYLTGLNVSELPDSIGSLTKLVELNLRENENLESLPDTICNLRSLEVLRITRCKKLKILPDGLWKITSLRMLDAEYASQLKKLPDIESSQIALSLQRLELSFTGIAALPSGFSQLSNLQSLGLSWCRHLLSIPKLPPNLKYINAHGCKSLERLPNLSNLKYLKELNLRNCRGLTYIRGFGDLISIRRLRLGGCSRLTNKHLTKQLLKVYSEIGHQISIYVSESPDQKSGPQWSDWILEAPYWTSGEYLEPTKLYAHILPNESHNFIGIILCFEIINTLYGVYFGYSVKNTTSGFIWSSDNLDVPSFGSLMVIVPKSIFSVTDDDNTIELTANNNVIIVGIHLLYKTETKTAADVLEKHVIDIDALNLIDHVLQDIFLDISCFFIGWEKNKVVQILGTYYTNVHHYIDILQNRCLLTINAQHELEMDDLHQYLGRKIVRNNSLDEPQKHSRLWLSVDIFDVLMNHKGTEIIEGIVPRKIYSERYNDEIDDALTRKSFTLGTFKKMRKLRFLYLRKVHLIGSFGQIFQDLRWLSWEWCPLKCLPSEFYPPELVILELRNSNIITMWELNMDRHVFKKLKTLDMSGSEDLTSTPDFTKLPCLQTLHLEGCKSLEEVHISIGSLARLVSLNLHGCVKLRSLPDTTCNLRALEVLDIRDCSCLEALPTALGNIQSLRKLDAGNLTVSVLPDSTGQLNKLVKLRLNSNKNLKILPVTSNLRSLEILDISGCEKLEMLPDQLCTITSLRELFAGGATLLKKFPHVESSQMTLSKLDFSQSGITALPSSISKLSNLEDLNLKDCHCLLSIPELPCKLKWIRANGCMSMGRLPDLSNLKQLEYLNLEDCSGLTEIHGLKGLISIRTLHLEGCNSSLLDYIFTESFFQIYSEFGHPTQICSTKFPDWISQSSEYESTMSSNEGSKYCSTMSLSLPPNVSYNYLGMILCISSWTFSTKYFVENTTSDFTWRGEFESYGDKSLMVIVPRSTFSIEDGDDTIKSEADGCAKIHGIHLLYKTVDED